MGAFVDIGGKPATEVEEDVSAGFAGNKDEESGFPASDLPNPPKPPVHAH